MDFAFSDEQIILRDSVRKMMDRLATPDYVRRLDREQAYPDALYAAWVEMGLLRLPFAEEYGGLGGSALDMVVLADEMARKSFDFFTAYLRRFWNVCDPCWPPRSQCDRSNCLTMRKRRFPVSAF